LSQSFESLVIPDALMGESGLDQDEGSKYVKFSDDVDGLTGPPDETKPLFCSPGTYNDGRPFADFSNELHLTLSSESVAEGETVTLIITLDQSAPAEGVEVML